jgi:hypothetical protein
VKVKIAAGAEFDIMTAKEMRGELDGAMKSWLAEVARGDRYRRFATYGDIGAAGGLSIGTGGDQPVIGPSSGFVWAVRRLAFTNYDPTAENMALYVSSADDSATIKPVLATYESFDSTQLVLYPGETLVVDAAGMASTGRVWMTGQARELPISLAWRL